jgi:opacity protein-like surface antigen
MKKTAILAIAAATMLTTSIGFAAPLTDYSAGKTSIDLIWRNSDNELKTSDGTDSLDKKSNLDFGITTGLGNNFAIQYNDYNAKSKETTLPDGFGGTYQEHGSLKTQELNVLYKIDKNVSAYTGVVRVKGNVNSDGNGFSSNTKNKMQFGLVGSTKIADKTTAYAVVGVASDYTNWKVGVSQEIAPNLEFTVDYRRLQAKKLTFDVAGTPLDADVTVKGLGFGVGYKF